MRRTTRGGRRRTTGRQSAWRAAFLLCWIAFGTAAAQEDPERAPRPGNALYLELIEFPPDRQGNQRIDVLYRVDRAFLVAARAANAPAGSPLRREGELSLEVTDSAGIVRGRKIERLGMDVSPADTLPIAGSFAGSAGFSLPPGRYGLAAELTDLQSSRRLVERRPPPPSGRGLTGVGRFSTPTLVEWNGRTAPPDTLFPVNLGGNARYGQSAAFWTMLDEPLPPGADATFTYVISEVFRQDTAVAIPDTTIRPLVLRTIPPRPATAAGRAAFAFAGDGTDSLTCLIVPVPAERLKLRTFRLSGRLTLGERTIPIGRPFVMVWPDMPLSLRDVERAIESLRPFTSEGLRDTLLEGGFEERRDRLEEFWARRDPTPLTAYNEVMAEYYRRVDHATRAFQTLRNPDGARTDRGRIYILYGPPSRSERQLDPALGFRERWVYDTQRREFVFRDEARTGDYVLVEGGR
jgi:GWxTD domain-containing protein